MIISVIVKSDYVHMVYSTLTSATLIFAEVSISLRLPVNSRTPTCTELNNSSAIIYDWVKH